MIGLIIGILGYIFSGSEVFGASMLVAVNWINTFYWILVVIVGAIGLLITFMGTAGGASLGSSGRGMAGGALGGFMVGGLMAAIVMAKTVIVLLLSYYLLDTIDPDIQGFSEFTTNQGLALGAMVILMIWPSSSNNSNNSN